MIAEPDVTLTDYALALVAGLFAVLLARRGSAEPARRALVLFFASVGVGALLGGTVHGFFREGTGPWGSILWRASLLAVGVTAFAAWSLSAALAAPAWARRLVVRAARVQLGGYAAVVLFISDTFVVAVVNYAPAAIVLLLALARAAVRSRRPALTLPVAGLVMMLLGSWVQWRGVGLEALALTHNALYHLIALTGLVLLFAGARAMAAVTTHP